MRRLALAFAVALLLSGCASPKAAPALPTADQQASGGPAGMLPTSANATAHTMRFEGGDREASMAFEDTFQPTESCIFGDTRLCPGAMERTHDLTTVVSPNVPVELTATLTTSGDVNVDFTVADAEILRYAEDQSGAVTTIDATVVRSGSGTIAMTLLFQFGSFGQPQNYASPTKLSAVVHTITRSAVVPTFLPVAIQLGAGDLVNATGDGLAQLVLFPPTGPAIRDLTFPFGIQLPATAPPGTYFLVTDADEAVTLTGPDRPLSARLLDFTVTPPVDVQANADTQWDMAVPGQPLVAGVQITSKDTAGLFSVAAIQGSDSVLLTSPANVEVLNAEDMCTVTCSFNLIGSGNGNGYQTPFLEEHLVPGTYHAKVSMQASNSMQASSWALSIRPAA
jgi:hypothetical protein